MTTVKPTAVRPSKGVLPAAEKPNSGHHPPPHDAAFVLKIEKADDLLRRYRNTLGILAQ